MTTDQTMDGRVQSRATRLVPAAVNWYFLKHPKRIVASYLEYAAAFRESFSILFLLKTLFSPWKSIKNSYPNKGFNVQAIAETFFLNITTRGIGAFIRLSAIVWGLLLQIVLLTGFLAYLVWWMLFPMIFLLLPLYIIISFFP